MRFARRRWITCGRLSASAPDPALATHRLGIAIIGQGVAKNEYRLFRKLRPQGVYFTQVKPGDGVQAAAGGRPRARRSVSGAVCALVYRWRRGLQPSPESLTRISYAALSGPRATLQSRMQKTYEAAVFDPEAFRTMLAQIKPEEAGLESGGDPVLNRFELSLLTEGSGTQVFSTTFVQWAAREALRRAQPLTLFTRLRPAAAREADERAAGRASASSRNWTRRVR